MDYPTLGGLLVSISCIALLYSSVGHGGASGYIFVMLVFGFAPAEIRPTVLLANIIVSSIAAVQFYRAGLFPWGLFWKFAVASAPFAFIGGSVALSPDIYKYMAGIVLCFSALRLLIGRAERFGKAGRAPHPAAVLAAGATIGFLSGLIGIGGGVFLSPLLILAGWAGLRETSSIAAFFVLSNSICGFLGQAGSYQGMGPASLLVLAAALIGGFTGSALGSRRLPLAAVRKALSAVLIIAAWKLLFI